ncbi:MAG: hypothetical protein A2V98_04845 [Planctomycetes bacterium RBG_16_64_12]|nr:MAG: hypothetical protein A2V98_04845 [Planctomycetes bacterium RBG_16_64_12]
MPVPLVGSILGSLGIGGAGGLPGLSAPVVSGTGPQAQGANTVTIGGQSWLNSLSGSNPLAMVILAGLAFAALALIFRRSRRRSGSRG